MDRRALGATAAILVLLMGIVATAGLDNLPKDLRTSVAAAATRVDTDRTLFQQHKTSVERALAAEPVLFRAREAAFLDRLTKDGACIAHESDQLAPLQQLVKANRRTDADKVRDGLSTFEQSRGSCLKDAVDLDADAQRWINYKKQLPARLAAMEEAHRAVSTFNIDSATAAAAKAKADWPAKQQDLDNRLAELKKLQESSEQIWTSTADLRAAAQQNKVDNFDYATFFQQADGMEANARNLKDASAGLNALAGQLYTSWDKLLLQVEPHDARQKVRIVRTKFADAALTNGQTTSEERWETIDSSRVRDAEKNAEMVIERKPAGKYDSEAEHVVQPPTYAYIAPPGQANTYGSWQNGVWQWLPQYLLLSQLLNIGRHSIDANEYYAWQQARQRGDIYYGRNRSYGPTVPDYRGRRPGLLRGALDALRNSGSSGGGWYHERPRTADQGSRPGGGFYTERAKPSWGSSGYSGSKYQSRGTFSGSKYQSRGTFGSGSSGFGSRSYSRGMGSGAMRSFGRGRR
jgi:hypothetical protein